jgi:hypothetical protein
MLWHPPLWGLFLIVEERNPQSTALTAPLLKRHAARCALLGGGVFAYAKDFSASAMPTFEMTESEKLQKIRGCRLRQPLWVWVKPF